MLEYERRLAAMNAMHSAWAKIDKLNPARWHSLVGHSLDVAAAFRALVASPAVAARLGRLAGGRLDERSLDRLAVLALLHDLGKANRGFQRRRDPKAARVGHILEVGGAFTAPPETQRRIEEGFLTPTLRVWMGNNEEAILRYLQAILSHHGNPVTDAWWPPSQDQAIWWLARPGEADPVAAVLELVSVARQVLPEAFAPGGAPLPEAPAFLHAFAGLLQLADWIGSHEDWFPFDLGRPEADRYATSFATAELKLRVIGFTRPDLSLPEPAFTALFVDRGGRPREPRPLQETAAEAPGRLVLLEAETGAGKTEAALYRFARLYAAGEVDALYFALPTRIAASQIHARVQDFAARFLPAGSAAVLLATPGDARIEEAPLPPGDDTFAENGVGGAIDDRAWAAERPKRFLAARIAVGTVDQALLASLKSRHAHMRAACLARALLVVDEVHASDIYMTAVLRRLLANHLRAGGHALLMSATLGSAAAAGLLAPEAAPVGPPSLGEALALLYPLLRGDAVPPQEITREGEPKRVIVEPRPVIDEPDAVAALAAAAAAAGAKVLVVRNTVTAAQATLAALEREGLGTPVFALAGRRTLHHGRFARADRRRLDAEVEARFGRERPPGGLVLIGTQTLEQSLDIDADLLITDLCPIDVLLQRIGRLHRHRDRERPRGFEAPRAIVAVPPEASFAGLTGRYMRGFGDPERAVYRDLLGLRATLDLLAAHPAIAIPDQNRALVEAATHPDALRALAERLAGDDDRAWLAHWEKLRGKGAAERLVADLHGLDMRQPFGREGFPSDEEVLTRLGAADRLLPLPSTPLGPFGTAIEEIALPGHWSWVPGLPADAVAEEIAPFEGGFTFRAGGTHLTYDRLGLRPVVGQFEFSNP